MAKIHNGKTGKTQYMSLCYGVYSYEHTSLTKVISFKVFQELQEKN